MISHYKLLHSCILYHNIVYSVLLFYSTILYCVITWHKRTHTHVMVARVNENIAL